MKKFLRLAVLLSLASTLAPADPANVPISTLLAPLAPGANSALLPAPRIDWVERVQNTNHRAQEHPDRIHLVFDGDSITDFWQGTGKAVWAQRYAKLGAFDFAISGDRTQHLLWRLDQGQIDGIKPKLVVLMIGTNNLGSNTVDQIAEGVTAIVKDYQTRAPDAVILLQAIFPRSKEPTDPLRAKIKAINAIIAKLDDGQKVVYLDFGDKFLQPDGTLSPDIMLDYLHPSAQGYQIWADAIQPVIDKYFPPAGK